MSSPDNRQWAFHALPQRCFPMHIEWIAERTGLVVKEEHIAEPGVLDVPALAEMYGPISVRLRTGDGSTHFTNSKGTTWIERFG